MACLAVLSFFLLPITPTHSFIFRFCFTVAGDWQRLCLKPLTFHLPFTLSKQCIHYSPSRSFSTYSLQTVVCVHSFFLLKHTRAYPRDSDVDARFPTFSFHVLLKNEPRLAHCFIQTRIHRIVFSTTERERERDYAYLLLRGACADSCLFCYCVC